MDLLGVMGQMVDQLANTEEGKAMTDNIGDVIGRLYNNLTLKQNIPAEHAATILSGLSKVGKN